MNIKNFFQALKSLGTCLCVLSLPTGCLYDNQEDDSSESMTIKGPLGYPTLQASADNPQTKEGMELGPVTNPIEMASKSWLAVDKKNKMLILNTPCCLKIHSV